MKARGRNLVHVFMPVLVVCLLVLTYTAYAAPAAAQTSTVQQSTPQKSTSQQTQSVTGVTPARLKYDPNAPPKGTITIPASSKGNVNASTWYTGSYQYIQWTCNGTYSNLVDVTLWQNNNQFVVISKGIASGQTGYTVPIQMVAGNYEVRITSAGDKRVEARKPIAVKLCTLAVTSPTQANTLWAGSGTSQIAWTFTGGNPGPLKLELVPAGGGSAQLIADKVSYGNSGSGQYSWQIPGNINAGNYQIQITSTGNSIMTARSPTFSLNKLGSVGIIVADPKNAPIDGATVTTIVNGTARSATTKTNGQALFDLLLPGTYTFTATKSGYYQPGTADTTVTLASGATQSRLITLERPLGTLKATVKDGTNPIRGIYVQVWNQNHSVDLTSDTLGDGTRTFTDVPEGNYSLRANPYTYNDTHQIKYAEATANATVTRGATATVNFSLQRFGNAIITVTDGTMPIYGASACLETPMRWFCGTTSDATGKVTVELPPGVQTLQVKAIGYKTGFLSVTISSGGTATGTVTLTK